MADEKGVKEEVISVPASHLEAMTMSMESLKREIELLKNPGVPQKTKRSTEHEARLRMYEDKLVTRIGKVRTNYSLNSHEPNAMVLPITVRDLEGKEEKLEVPFRPFLEGASSVNCRIIKQEIRSHEVVDRSEGGGGVDFTKAFKDKNGKVVEGMGGEVEYAVTYQEVSFDLLVLEGPFKDTVVHFDHKDTSAINA